MNIKKRLQVLNCTLDEMALNLQMKRCQRQDDHWHYTPATWQERLLRTASSFLYRFTC